jgi:hypothetical protein
MFPEGVFSHNKAFNVLRFLISSPLVPVFALCGLSLACLPKFLHSSQPSSSSVISYSTLFDHQEGTPGEIIFVTEKFQLCDFHI